MTTIASSQPSHHRHPSHHHVHHHRASSSTITIMLSSATRYLIPEAQTASRADCIGGLAPNPVRPAIVPQVACQSEKTPPYAYFRRMSSFLIWGLTSGGVV